MVQQVMPPRELQPNRQPSSHVSAPMDLLINDVVDRETQEHSRANSVIKKLFDRECRGRIQQKYKYHH